jgi:hypothetical protein
LQLTAPLAFAAKTETYTGEARNGDRLAYTEKHVVHFDDKGDITDADTTYLNAKGEVISTLHSDFRKSLTAPDHVLKDTKTGSTQGMRTVGDKLVLFNQDEGKPEMTKEFPNDFGGERVAFGCQGLNYYLLKNMDDFAKKKELPIKFMLPGILDSYDFEVKYVKEEADGVVDIEVEIDNWLLRLFAPKLKVRYDKKKQHIITYEGLSNIKDERGKNQNVTITYKYDTP